MQMRFKCQVDTVLNLNYQHPCTKIGKNALPIPAYYLGTIYGFFLVSFDEMQKILQGQESYVYREMEYNRLFFFFSFFLLHIWISAAHSLWLSATGYDWSLDNSSLCDKLFKVRPGAVSVPRISGFYIFSSLILNLNDNKCNLTPDGTEHIFTSDWCFY